MIDSLQAFILIGGASSRMGTDKARLLIKDRTLVEHIASALFEITDSVTLVGRHQTDQFPDFPSTPDLHEHWGALGGLHAALSACRADWAVVVACDLPFITAPLLSRLASFAVQVDAVAPIQANGIPQPLCSFYRVSRCLSLAQDLIQTGERKPVALLQSVNTRWVEFAELADLEAADHLFDNINTPEDFARANEEGDAVQSKRKK